MNAPAMYCDVSVIIPHFNRSSFLRRALNSVACQTVRPREVLLIDDCSNHADRNAVTAMISEFSSRLAITSLRNDCNMGANHSRNRGIAAASSKYIAFLDSDDLWLRRKLEIQMREIASAEERTSKPLFSATARYRVDHSGTILARQMTSAVFTAETIKRSNHIGTLSSVLVDAAAARAVSGFDESFQASQDWDFYIRLAQHVCFVEVPVPLSVYVDHNGSDRITLNARRKMRGHLQIYRKHLKQESFSSHQIYKLIAEDYQMLGKARQANRFYVEAITQSFAKGCISKGIMRCSLRTVYAICALPSITLWRYRSYRMKLLVQKMNRKMARDMKASGSEISQLLNV